MCTSCHILLMTLVTSKEKWENSSVHPKEGTASSYIQMEQRNVCLIVIKEKTILSFLQIDTCSTSCICKLTTVWLAKSHYGITDPYRIRSSIAKRANCTLIQPFKLPTITDRGDPLEHLINKWTGLWPQWDWKTFQSYCLIVTSEGRPAEQLHFRQSDKAEEYSRLARGQPCVCGVPFRKEMFFITGCISETSGSYKFNSFQWK